MTRLQMPDLPEKDSGKIRILHTADWHLGREFHGRDMSELHLEFFKWLAEQIEARKIDLVLMAGDIYDRALPPVSAISLFNEQMAKLSALAPFVMITGNHDSTVRMSHGPLLREGIHLRSGIESIGEPVTFEEPFPLAVYPVPYLDPMTVAGQFDLDSTTHDAVIGEAVRRSLADLEAREGVRSIAIGHAFVTGAVTSESERSIQVGGAEDVSSTVFGGFDYVALGHLHRPQSVGDRVRYSGSPIPLSYSEVDGGAGKSVAVIELSADGSVEIETVDIPQLVRMGRISGELDFLLDDDSLEDVKSDWLEVTRRWRGCAPAFQT